MEPVYAVKRPKPTIFASQGRLVPRGQKGRPQARPAYTPRRTPSVTGDQAATATAGAASGVVSITSRGITAGATADVMSMGSRGVAAGATAGNTADVRSMGSRGVAAESGIGAVTPVADSFVRPGVPKRIPVDGRPDLPWFPTASFVRRTHGTRQRAEVRGLWRTFVFTSCLGAAVTASHLAYYL